MDQFFDPDTPSTELEIFLNGDLLDLAEKLGIDISKACEEDLENALKEKAQAEHRR